MKNCVRCGVHISDEYNKLRCDKCKKLVDEEFKGEANREFEFYFKYHLKRQRALDRKIDEVIKKES